MLADRIAILMDGMLQQFGAPADVYYRPRTAAVASFTGLANLLPARIESGSAGRYTLATQAGAMEACGPPGLAAGIEVLVSIRPEDLRLDGGGNRLSGVVRERSFAGSFIDYRIAVAGDVLLRIQAPTGTARGPGEEVAVSINPDAAWVVPR